MLILADWATAVAAIGGALIGAAAGVVAGYLTFRGAALNVRYQERESWRSREIEAAQAFVEFHTKFLERLGRHIWRGDEITDEDRAAIAAIGADATRSNVLIGLLCGPESPITTAADEVNTAMTVSIGQVPRLVQAEGEERATVLGEVEEQLEAADEPLTRFMELMSAEVRPSNTR